MDFQCPRCHYTTHVACNFKKHLARKEPCEPLFNTDTIDDILQQMNVHKYKNKPYKCECGRAFSSMSSRSNHKRICNVVSDNRDGDRKEVLKLRQEMETLKGLIAHQANATHNNTVNNTVNNTIHNNTVNNYIVLKDFGNEREDHLPKDLLTHCFMMQNIPLLIENIFFDKDCPENHNVRLASLKNKLMQIYSDRRWITKPSEQILDQLVDKGTTILKRHYRNNTEDVEAEMTEEEVQEVLDWLNRILNNNKKIRVKLAQELVAVMHTYRERDS